MIGFQRLFGFVIIGLSLVSLESSIAGTWAADNGYFFSQEVSSEQAKKVMAHLLNQIDESLQDAPHNKNYLLNMLSIAKAELAHQTADYPELTQKGEQEIQKYESFVRSIKSSTPADQIRAVQFQFKLDQVLLLSLF